MSQKRRPNSRGPFVLEIEVVPPERPSKQTGYPLNIPAIASLGRLSLSPSITFLVGENGAGKSTILEAIACAVGLNPEGGSRNFNFATRESHSTLHRHLRVSRTTARPTDLYFLRAESYFNVASEIEALDREPGAGPPIISYYGGRSLHEQSHGESFESGAFNARAPSDRGS